MSEEPVDLAAVTFRDLLNVAILHGRPPCRTPILGPATTTALDALAGEHPDAAPEHIVAAFEAFAIEHRGSAQTCLDPPADRAAENAAIDALICQLAITYRDLDPVSLGAIVRRVHADFEHLTPRQHVLLLVEHEVRQRLA